MNLQEQAINEAAKVLKNSNNVVAFTGAGISVESGIPDFRSVGGLWDRFNPDLYADYFTFLDEPHYYWKLERELAKMVGNVKPNPAHLALVDLEKMGKLKAIITQNIDMLHQAAGSAVPIHELHGSGAAGRCVKCRKRYTREEILKKMAEMEDIEDDSQVPKCDSCNGLVKYDIVLFGEMLPQNVLSAAEAALNECDCMIIIGSSLAVSPANMLPFIARRNGASIILVNLDSTLMETRANVHVAGKAGEVLPKIIEKLKTL